MRRTVLQKSQCRAVSSSTRCWHRSAVPFCLRCARHYQHPPPDRGPCAGICGSCPPEPRFSSRRSALVAKDEPVLRTLYIKWPWPHFYEFPQTLALIVVAPDASPDGVLPFPGQGARAEASLAEADASDTEVRNPADRSDAVFPQNHDRNPPAEPDTAAGLGDRPEFRPSARQLFRHLARHFGCGFRRR